MDPDDQHGGLGWYAQAPLVVNPKLAAPRGEQFTNEYVQRIAYDGDSLFEGEEEDAGDNWAPVRATLDTAISEDNVGFRMLKKMGWSAGKGLGRNEDGIVEPVRTGVDDGVRLGLGKQEQDDFFTNVENVQRKRLETEIQATEDDARKERREAQAERDAKIKQEVADIKKTFYCDMCHKQYTTAMELDAHLSSYDHHHKKRLVEMRAMEAGRTKSDRMKKEQKNADREAARLQKQIEKAAAEKGAKMGSQGQSQPPLPPEPPPLPPAVGGGWEPPPPPLPPTGDSSISSGSWEAAGQLPGTSGRWGAAAQQQDAPPPPPPPPLPVGSGISFGLSMKVASTGSTAAGMAGRGGVVARGGLLAGRGPLGRGRGAAAVHGRGMISAAAGAFGMSDSDEEEGS